MNYRHQFHAGNFADVVKHYLLLRVLRALQRKDKGLLYLDSHAGRGTYDLARAAHGDSLERQPEWPAGIGRLWSVPGLPAGLQGYVELVRTYDRQQGNLEASPRFYPGSPRLVGEVLRPQDRMALCERLPDECQALRAALGRTPQCLIREEDGYQALRALLPPRERRALVLIDPPYESKREFDDIVTAVEGGLRRLPGGTFLIWYPLTVRARVDEFFDRLQTLPLPPTAVAELAVAGEDSPLKMRGCGLVVLNPPWQLADEVTPVLGVLAELLAQAAGAAGTWRWLVPER